jgi:hypothetical protein
VQAFLENGHTQLNLWGEAAIPQFLAYCWFLRRVSPGAADGMLASVMYAIVRRDPDQESGGLASPYWDAESVARHSLASILHSEDPMKSEAIGRVSFFAEALLHLLVRTNSKNECKAIWPMLTRLQLAQFIPRHRWQYCLSSSDEGREEHVIPPRRKEWVDLVNEARSIRCSEVPEALLSLPLLHALFITVFPYRATPAVVRRVSFEFDRRWLISGEPIE